MQSSAVLVALLPAALAMAPPAYDGYDLVWAESFPGARSTLPSANNWNVVQGYLGVNAELEVYTSSTGNVQNSGNGTVQLVPWRDPSARSNWTSGRLESTYNFTPSAKAKTAAEASIRFGSAPPDRKKGLWPAFWLLGQSIRQGQSWPACGEIDVLETVDGQLTGHGTVHCGTDPGGICNEPTGLGKPVAMADQDWHTWRVVWDRTPADWHNETITWFQDGRAFHQVSGTTIGDATVWDSLAHKPMFFILNMAVGGEWPGYPDNQTVEGYDGMMEVAYVAHYCSRA